MLRGRDEITAVLAAAKAVCGDTRGDDRATDLAGLALAIDKLGEAIPGIERLLKDWPDEGKTEFMLRSRNGRLLGTFPTRELLDAFERVCPQEGDLVIEESGV